MNLINLYLEKEERRARQEEERRRAADPWYDFHNTNEQKMVIVAGRRSGKTYNLVRKIMEAEVDNVMIITSSNINKNLIRRMISELYVTEIQSNSMESIITRSGKRIYISYPTHERSYKGRRLDLIAYDEPELMNFFMRDIRESLLPTLSGRSLVREIAVGSLMNLQEDTEFKRMYREADWKANIPTPGIDRTGELNFELNPIRFRHAYENTEEYQAI
jgi:predicted transcriptional regulator